MSYEFIDIPNPLTRPKAIIFDWDNTLIDSWGVIHHALMATFDEMGHPQWDIAETKARVRHSLRDNFPILFGDRWEMARDAYYRHFDARHLHELKAIDGAEQFLECCHQAEIPMLIVSNKTGQKLRLEVEALGWQKYFHHVLGAGDAPKDKPDPIVVNIALSSIDATPGQDVWFMGDTDVDLICAERSGCWPILVGNRDELGKNDLQKPIKGWFFHNLAMIHGQMFEDKQFS